MLKNSALVYLSVRPRLDVIEANIKSADEGYELYNEATNHVYDMDEIGDSFICHEPGPTIPAFLYREAKKVSVRCKYYKGKQIDSFHIYFQYRCDVGCATLNLL